MPANATPIQPVSDRLPAIFAYPAHKAMLWMIAALCALRLLNHLPSLLGLVFELAFWVMGFKLAVEALVNTVHGRFEPMGAEDMMATDGEAVNQILLMLVVFLPIQAIALWGSPAVALCLLGLSAFAQSAAAAQWVDSGRTAYVKTSFFGSFAYHTCDSSGAQIQGYPGSCGSDAGSGWTSNYTASSDLANSQLMACNHNPFQLGSACYGLAYAINGQAYAGGLPAACAADPDLLCALQGAGSRDRDAPRALYPLDPRP